MNLPAWLAEDVPENHPWTQSSILDHLDTGDLTPEDVTDPISQPAPFSAVVFLILAVILLIPALIIGGLNGLTVAGMACAAAGVITTLIHITWKQP